MSGTTTRTSPPPVTVVFGPESFLAERAVADVRAAVRSVDADAEFSEHLAGSLEGAGALSGLTAPSLFSSTRVVLIDGAADADPDVGAALLDYAAAPADDIYLVVAHGGGPKGKGWLDKLRRTSGVAVIACDKPKPRDLPGFVLAEVRAVGGTRVGRGGSRPHRRGRLRSAGARRRRAPADRGLGQRHHHGRTRPALLRGAS